MKNLSFEIYDKDKHDKLLTEWNNQRENIKNYINYINYGICCYKDVPELFSHFQDSKYNEKQYLKFVIKDDKNDCVGVVVLVDAVRDDNVRELDLRHLIVAPNYQNNGIGSETIKSLIETQEIIDINDFDEFITTVDKTNQNCLKLMKKFNFEENECFGVTKFCMHLGEKERNE